MAVGFSNTNKPFNPRGNDQSPLAFNRAKLYSGKALDFDGVNDSIDISNFSLNGYTAFSICFYKTDDFNNAMIFSSADSISDGVNIYQVSPGYFRARLNGFNTDTDLEVSTKKGFFVLTYDGSDLNWYYQAQNIGSSTTSRTFSIANTTSTIGRQSFASTQYLNGQIAGVKVFNTALTATQVADLYNNPEKIVPTGVADSALKLWLPMQEGAGTTAINGAPDALGSEQIENGDFATDSNWTKGSGWTISGGTANATSASTGTPLSQYIDTGKKYRVTYDVVSLSQGAFQVDLSYSGTALGQVVTTTGTFTDVITSINPALSIRVVGTTTGSIDNVSVKELTNFGTISGATWTHGIGAPVAQTAVINWNKASDGTNEVLIPQGLTSGRDLLGNLFENVRKQGALNLDGNSWAEVHDNASLDMTSAITLEAWVYSSASDPTAGEGIISKWHEGSNNRSYLMYALDYDTFYFFLSNDGTATNNISWSLDGVELEQYNHFVCTFDGSSFKAYKNGSLATTGTTAFSTLKQSDKNVAISNFNVGQGQQRKYSNSIAQPRIYNRALTAEEVLQNYNSGKNTYK